ncbi:Leucyl/phenylalanyl-tRNA--protein transferase [hydrothermal vent metagenome]|uniref:Leucyl/phenylalanyl-tRNA--protein transferase n=1 Tax=hydrothermal vent metagenome TaxID=652676 RepID=A0A3B1A374_9ZZZZ
MTAPYLLSDDLLDTFPNVELALAEPNGLLAVGGDLSAKRLLAAYKNGIFPWFSDEQPIMWWSPNPRSVLKLDNFKISRSLKKTLNKNTFHITFDTAFDDVIQACATTRKDGFGTWITNDMLDAYRELHKQGYAHSVECWFEKKLVGGLYGLSLGHAFFGESMFTHKTDASKVALAYLVAQLKQWQFDFIDAQVSSEHMTSLGAIELPRSQFIEELQQTLKYSSRIGKWYFDYHE